MLIYGILYIHLLPPLAGSQGVRLSKLASYGVKQKINWLGWSIFIQLNLLVLAVQWSLLPETVREKWWFSSALLYLVSGDVWELLTVNEGAIEPLDVIVFGEGEEDLVTNDGEGQQEDGTTWHCQGEGAQVHSANGIKQCGECSCAANIYLKYKSDWCPPIYLSHLCSCPAATDLCYLYMCTR